jgi:hypothetical protein
VFAYGQTGTGKTFTMEGQFGDSSFSNMYSNAGVVPRAVEHVFKYLEENDLEYQAWPPQQLFYHATISFTTKITVFFISFE